MGVSFLHVSDIHFGISDPDGEHARITKGVINAAKELNFDFVIFSGDLAQRAEASEFQNGFDWLSELGKIAKRGIIVCPGNHDIDRNKADKKLLRLSCPSADSFNLQRSDIQAKSSQVEPFLTWHQEASQENQLFLNKWSNDPFIDKITENIDGVQVHFVCLNSAILSCDDDDEEALCIDISSANAGMENINSAEELVVFVTHHPTSCLVEWNRTKITELIKQETGPHILFHGHMHETELNSTADSSGASIFTSSAGACYQGSKWAQSFTHLEIDFETNTIKPTVFSYHPESGKWLPDPKLSRPVTVNLPVPTSQSTNKHTTPTDKKTASILAKSDSNMGLGNLLNGFGKKLENPFDLFAANAIDPHLIPKLFVDRNNYINTLSNKFDTIIEGQRGTGKTMLLRYLSIDVQSLPYEKDDWKTGIDSYGIYCQLQQSGLSRSDFDAIENSNRRDAIFAHRLTLYLIAKSLRSTLAVWQKDLPLNDDQNELAISLRQTLRLGEVVEYRSWGAFVKSIESACNNSIEEIDEHVESLLPGGFPTSFNPRLSLSVTFIGFLNNLKEALGIQVPFYLLLDDFDALTASQQTNIFQAAAERNNELLCFKFGVMSFGKKTILSGGGRTYREGDDFEYILLNWIDKGLSGDRGDNYSETVIEIANKRIEESTWDEGVTFDNLFSTWVHGKKIRQEVKKIAQKEYDALPKSNRPETFENYWSKQGVAKYFRYLKKKKIEHRYAGPQDIVDISSGIFRQFLEICSRIFTSAADRGWEPKNHKKITAEIQNDAIRVYSENMMKSIGETSGDSSFLHAGEFNITNTHIHRLAESLSRFFYERLHSDCDDAEVIAIAVKGSFDTPSFGRVVLDVAVRESILQRRTTDYPSKSGGGIKFPTYVLNRRLAPRKSLGTKLQGRYEIALDDIELAAKDSDAFIRKMMKSDEAVRQRDIFDA